MRWRHRALFKPREILYPSQDQQIFLELSSFPWKVYTRCSSIPHNWPKKSKLTKTNDSRGKTHTTDRLLVECNTRPWVAWTQWIIRSALTFEWMATYQSRYLRSSLAPLHLLAMYCKSRSMYQHHHYHQDQHHPLHPDHHHQNKYYLHFCFIHCFAIFNSIIRIINDIIAICI